MGARYSFYYIKRFMRFIKKKCNKVRIIKPNNVDVNVRVLLFIALMK